MDFSFVNEMDTYMEPKFLVKGEGAMTYRVGICDNEKGTGAEIENIILNYFKMVTDKVETFVWITGEGCCSDLKNRVSIDVLFLEIELSEKNGVDVGKYIRDELENDTVKIIYISSTTSYVMELFQVHPYDFFVKPIKKEKIEQTLETLLKLEKENKQLYSFVSNRNTYKIPFGDILYFRSNDKYIEIYLMTKKVYRFRGKLKDELPRLPHQFVMIRQSDVINVKYLRESHYDYVIMADETRINISQRFRTIFRNKTREYNYY